MTFQVNLFIQRLHSGFSLMTVLGEDSVQLLTQDEERGREEIQLLLSDRLERLHPGRLSPYAKGAPARVLRITLPEALPVQTASEAPELRPMQATALLTRDRRWQRLWLPRWDLRYWLPHDADPEEAAAAILTEVVARLDPHERLELRTQGDEALETVEIDVQRAPLAAFTDKLAGASILPEPLPKADPDKDDEEEDEEDDDATPRPRNNKKKRPPTPNLQRIATSLSRLARDEELERAHGRERELQDLLKRLAAPGGSAWVLLGESGVGKSTLLNELVYRVARKDAPKHLHKRPVWFVDASRLVAGEGWFGDWQRQCLDVVQEAIDAEIIWYIGDPLALVDAGRSIASDQNVALLLKPFLASRRITVVAESTPRRWSQLEQRDVGFARLFTPYRLSEPEPAETRAILAAVAAELERDTDVRVAPDGLRAVEELSARFGAEGSRLGGALHFLRRLVEDAETRLSEAAEAAERASAPPPPQPLLKRAHVVQHLCAETGMPPFLVQDDLPMDPQAVWAHFRARLIGQDEAVRRMTDLVAMIKAGLSDLRRPLGSFLFVGPTGVGKTEMAKALTEFIFGRPDRMIRYDMSEFIRPDSVHRFIGADGREGQLVSQIRRAPFGVLLLDEIEKAHPAVFDVLLQVLGEARLTDQAGRTADFRNTIVLMTSNLGVDTFRARPGFAGGPADRSFREHFEAEARRFFRPELLNRIDFIIPFEPLGRDAIDRITLRELDRFKRREGIQERRLDLRLADDVPAWLAAHGVDPRYGARPLKRLIERALTQPLAVHISEKSSTSIQVDTDGDALAFHALQPPRSHQRAALESDRFLQRAALVRYRAQRWLRSEPAVEMDHQLRLLDRLSQDRTFWKDAAWANTRLQHAARPRQILAALREAFDHIASIEDLAFEMHLQRHTNELPLLQRDLDEAEARLRTCELDLYAARLRSPERVDLFITPTKENQLPLRDLLEAWFSLGQPHGWTFSLREPVEDPATARERAEREQERAARAERAGKAPAAPRKERVSKREDLWSWRARAATYTTLASDADDDATQRNHNARTAFLADITQLHPLLPLHLTVTGPHAGLLHAEAGTHLIIDSDATRVLAIATLDRPPDHPLPSPTAARDLLPSRRRRVIHTVRRTITDLVLDSQLPWDGRLAKPLLRFNRAALYDAVFGPGAWKMFL